MLVCCSMTPHPLPVLGLDPDGCICGVLVLGDVEVRIIRLSLFCRSLFCLLPFLAIHALAGLLATEDSLDLCSSYLHFLMFFLFLTLLAHLRFGLLLPARNRRQLRQKYATNSS